jgi:hypothetical protein
MIEVSWKTTLDAQYKTIQPRYAVPYDYQKTAVVISGENAEQFTSNNPEAISKAVFLNHGVYIYGFILNWNSVASPHKDTLNQILSTFKFTEPTAQFDAANWKTYSSAQYGFSFDYPSKWKVTEKTNTNGQPYVDLTSDIFSSDPQLSGIPEEEIQFSAVDTNYFNPPIGTKFGMIGYDSKDNLLIDTTQPSQQCLLVRPLLGIENAPLGFRYDGSQMSTPAHFNYALITQNKKIILVTEFSLEGDTLLVVNQNVSKIALSFKLLNGDSIPRVNCVSAPN